MAELKNTNIAGKLTADGDTEIRGRLFADSSSGSSGYVLISTGTGVQWSPLSGTSGFVDITLPTSSTDNAIARFDGTTGKVLQNSAVTIDDNGVVKIGANGGFDVSARATVMTNLFFKVNNNTGIVGNAVSNLVGFYANGKQVAYDGNNIFRPTNDSRTVLGNTGNPWGGLYSIGDLKLTGTSSSTAATTSQIKFIDSADTITYGKISSNTSSMFFGFGDAFICGAEPGAFRPFTGQTVTLGTSAIPWTALYASNVYEGGSLLSAKYHPLITESAKLAWNLVDHPSWIESSKPSYTLDEVADGTTRKLSNYLTSVKSIKTDNTSAQSTSSNESLKGSGTVNLHKISKTGNYNDLLNKPTLDNISDGTTRKWADKADATLNTNSSGGIISSTLDKSYGLAAGSQGKICVGKFGIYDSNITIKVTSTTNTTYSGTIVIATQNGRILEVTVYGDAQKTLTNKLYVAQEQYIASQGSITKKGVASVYIELNGYSKNKIDIKAIGLDSSLLGAYYTNVMTIISDSNPWPNYSTEGTIPIPAGTNLTEPVKFTRVKNDIKQVITGFVTSVNGQPADDNGNVEIELPEPAEGGIQAVKSINSTNTTAQSVNASEVISGTGTIQLHKVAKTGSYNDLNDLPGIPSSIADLSDSDVLIKYGDNRYIGNASTDRVKIYYDSTTSSGPRGITLYPNSTETNWGGGHGLGVFNNNAVTGANIVFFDGGKAAAKNKAIHMDFIYSDSSNEGTGNYVNWGFYSNNYLMQLKTSGDLQLQGNVYVGGGSNGDTKVLNGNKVATESYVSTNYEPIIASKGSAFNKDFGGNGSATTVARSDHNHDGVYLKSYTEQYQGTVKSVNSVGPDASGNVTLDYGTVKSVNGTTPDISGNVTISVGTNYSLPIRLANYNANGSNANDVTEQGWYYIKSDDSNRPSWFENNLSSGSNDYRIMTTAYSNVWLQQIATNFRSNDMALRVRYKPSSGDAIWGNWVPIVTGKYLTSSAPTNSVDLYWDATNKKVVANTTGYLNYTTNNSVTIPGPNSASDTKSSTTLKFNVSSPMVIPNGIIIGGTAQSAGLVTRGLCGVSSPDANTGACTKDNLYVNYDGDNVYRIKRQIVLQAGSEGSQLYNGQVNNVQTYAYQFAAVRGDAMVGYVTKYVSDNAQSKGNYVTTDTIQTITGQKTFTNTATFFQSTGQNSVLKIGGISSTKDYSYITLTDSTRPLILNNLGGNVNIGGTTIAPQYKLNVDGSINCTSLYVNGTAHDSKYVTTDTDQTITGLKTFSNDIMLNGTVILGGSVVGMSVDPTEGFVKFGGGNATRQDGEILTSGGAQNITGTKTFKAPANQAGSEQSTVWFETANGGRIGFGKEGPNSGTGIFFDQVSGTRRLNFRGSATAGAIVWSQPESNSCLFFDVNSINFRNCGGYTMDTNGIIPQTTNVRSLGSSSKKFNNTYATNGHFDSLWVGSGTQTDITNIKNLRITSSLTGAATGYAGAPSGSKPKNSYYILLDSNNAVEGLLYVTWEAYGSDSHKAVGLYRGQPTEITFGQTIFTPVTLATVKPMTQTAYNNLGTKDSNTLYVITG